VNQPSSISFGDLLNPTHMFFCKRRPDKKMGDIVLCVCMHSTLVRCERCDVDDNADIMVDYIFWMKRARLCCILWNKPEEEWV